MAERKMWRRAEKCRWAQRQRRRVGGLEQHPDDWNGKERRDEHEHDERDDLPRERRRATKPARARISDRP